MLIFPCSNLTFGDIYASVLGLGSRFRRKVAASLRLSPRARVLDLGCGRGRLLKLIHEMYPEAELVGSDIDESSIEAAKKRVGQRARLKNEGATIISEKDNSLDMVVSTLVFHHLDVATKKLAVAEIYRALRPGGRVLIADFGKSDSKIERLIARIVCPRAEATEENLNGIVSGLLKEAGFENIKVTDKTLRIVHFLNANKPN